ncbi:hypothetical protein [Pantanalinema sp. GBBB05]|uniref:hypothetical protein n=1 Tax=Pantanalinema sp. GBBB05 TaxID=2604139 RepID=UPI001DC30D66|nr:hypothetical protein [Pantanalinema sp. GBBB05]
MQQTDQIYAELSRLHFSMTQKGKILLFPNRVNKGSAALLKIADEHRLKLKGLDYEAFCNLLAELADISYPYSIDGHSADLVLVYQYIHNAPEDLIYVMRLLDIQHTEEGVDRPSIQLPVPKPPSLEQLNNHHKTD